MPYWWSKERIEGTSGGIGGLTIHIEGLSGYAPGRYGILLPSVFANWIQTKLINTKKMACKENAFNARCIDNARSCKAK